MMQDLTRRARFDLHLHTSRSDGRYDPQEVLRRCARARLDVVSLTDHDLGSPVDPGVHEIEGHRLRVVGGAEVSGMHHGREYHLLVYFPGQIPQAFHDFCQLQCRSRAERYALAIQNLGLFDLPPADIEAKLGNRALTRLHIARAMVDLGHASDVSDAFRRFLSEVHGKVPPLRYDMVDAIRFSRACGGVTSWAHPARKCVEEHIRTFVAAGLQGLEGLRPYLNARDRGFYRRMATRHGLFLTGGSDWHGWRGDELGLFYLEAHAVQDFVDALAAA